MGFNLDCNDFCLAIKWIYTLFQSAWNFYFLKEKKSFPITNTDSNFIII